MRSGHRRALVGLLAGAAALTGVLALGVSPASAIIARLANGKYLSYEAISGAKAPNGPKPSPFDSVFSNLDYSGGPVMPSNTNYTIVWSPSNYGSGTPFQGGYTSGVDTFFTDLAHDSGQSTNSDSVATQYNDSAGHSAAYVSANGGQFTAVDPLPANGCPALTGHICLTDAQLQAELNTVVAAHGLPRDLTHQYFLLTPPDVASCFDAAGTSCSANADQHTKFCAYHSASATAGGSFLYSNIPDLTGVGGCDPFVTSCPNLSCNYNNGAADGVLSAISHEHNETTTDPQPNNAWTDWGSSIGGENGDKCNNDGMSSPNLVPQDDGSFTDTPYNQSINGHHYLIQREWSNNGHACLDNLASNSAPTAAFTNSPGASATTVNFDASGSTVGTGTQYVWQFNDDVNPGHTPQQSTIETASPTISHTFPQTGVYTVALTVMKADGTSRGSARNITVANPPNAGFNVTTGAPFEGQPVSFASTSADPNAGGSISSYSWNFGDGSPAGSGPNPAHAYQAGAYNITLTVTNNFGLQSTVTHGISVVDEGAGAAFNSPGAVIKGHGVRFSGAGSDPDGSITSYSWNFGDGSTGSGASPLHTYSHGGTFTVGLTVTDSAGHRATASHPITVLSPVNYRGHTAQNQSISFSIASGLIFDWDFRIVDSCGGKKALKVHASFGSALAISGRGSFGGTFNPGREPTVLSGKLKGSKVTGSISDTTFYSKLHKFCHGHTTFTAKKS